MSTRDEYKAVEQPPGSCDTDVMRAAIDAERQVSNAPLRRRFVVFTLFDERSAESLLTQLKQPVLTDRERARLRAYRVGCWVREIGWLAGLLAFVAFFSAALALTCALTFRFAIVETLAVVSVTLGLCIWGTFVWVVAYVGVGAAVPSTSFAFRLDDFYRYAGISADAISRGEVNFAISASGALARVLFRSLTKRFMNAGIRPDLATQVSDLCRYLLIALPDGGPDALRRNVLALSRYGRLAREIGTLLVIQRVDLIPLAAERYPEMSLVALDDDMEKFIHPLAKRSLIEATAEFVVPVIAGVLSVVALVVSIVK